MARRPLAVVVPRASRAQQAYGYGYPQYGYPQYGYPQYGYGYPQYGGYPQMQMPFAPQERMPNPCEPQMAIGDTCWQPGLPDSASTCETIDGYPGMQPDWASVETRYKKLAGGCLFPIEYRVMAKDANGDWYQCHWTENNLDQISCAHPQFFSLCWPPDGCKKVQTGDYIPGISQQPPGIPFATPTPPQGAPRPGGFTTPPSSGVPRAPTPGVSGMPSRGSAPPIPSSGGGRRSNPEVPGTIEPGTYEPGSEPECPHCPEGYLLNSQTGECWKMPPGWTPPPGECTPWTDVPCCESCGNGGACTGCGDATPVRASNPAPECTWVHEHPGSPASAVVCTAGGIVAKCSVTAGTCKIYESGVEVDMIAIPRNFPQAQSVVEAVVRQRMTSRKPARRGFFSRRGR